MALCTSEIEMGFDGMRDIHGTIHTWYGYYTLHYPMLFCFRSLFAVEYMLILVSSEVVLLRRLVTTHEVHCRGSVPDKSQLKHTMFPNTIMILC